jgi:hypothetical protein
VEQTKQFICLRPLIVRFDLAGLLDKELGLLPVVRFTKAVLAVLSENSIRLGFAS